MTMLELLFFILLLVILGIFISAARNRIIFKLGVRNIGRRKGNTAIVAIGLMIGTAIITASLVIGDTMDNMVDTLIVEGMGEVDLLVVDLDSDETDVFTYQNYTLIKADILALEHVDGVLGEYSGALPVGCMDTRQSDPGMGIMGVNATELPEFGGLVVDGKEITFDLDVREVYINLLAAKELEAEAGTVIQIYNATGPQHFTVKQVVDSTGYANWNLRRNVIMDIEMAQEIFNVPNVINLVKITNKGDQITGAQYSTEVEDTLELILDERYPGFEAVGNKEKTIEEGRASISQLTDLFLVFGSFTIIAGVILIINIFVMVAEERKTEMGISRAIGMKRKHLRKMFLYEGSAYAAIAGVVGCIFGLGIAYLSMWAIKDMASAGDASINVLSYYAFTFDSLAMSFIAGFLLTVATILFVTGRISRLNIVRAIRKIPEPMISRKDARVMITGIVGLVLSLLLLMMGTGGKQAGLAMAGLSLIVYSIGMLVRRFVGDRAAFTASPLIVLFLWMGPFEPFAGYSAGLEMFILSGLFLVGSTIILVMFNSDTILGMVSALGSRKKAGQAVFKIALSYPLKNKFRTGMTIMIFGLIIFTIVVLSMIVNIFNVNIEKTIEENSGGFDIYGYVNPETPIGDIDAIIQANQNLSESDFVGIYPLTYTYSRLDLGDANRTLYYNILGCDDDFIESNGYTFHRYLDNFSSDREVWEALRTNPEYIIIDGTIEGNEYGPSFQLFETDIGETVTLSNKTGQWKNFTVIGVLKENFLQGFFVHNSTGEAEFGLSQPNVFMFQLREGTDSTAIARDLERELFQYGFQPIVIGDLMERATQDMNQFFNLFSAFLGTGLIIGISALGIITLRSVHERRLEIGMLRAIGFKRRMITKSFVYEAVLIAVWGMIIGTIHGIYVGWYIWDEGFRDMDYVFGIPWLKIFIVLAIAGIFTLLCVIPSSHQASKVEPAEALRFE